MRSHSFQSFLSLSALLAGLVRGDSTSPARIARADDLVVVKVWSTVYVCPTPPPTCPTDGGNTGLPGPGSTSSTTSNGGVTTTTATSVPVPPSPTSTTLSSSSQTSVTSTSSGASQTSSSATTSPSSSSSSVSSSSSSVATTVSSSSSSSGSSSSVSGTTTSVSTSSSSVSQTTSSVSSSVSGTTTSVSASSSSVSQTTSSVSSVSGTATSVSTSSSSVSPTTSSVSTSSSVSQTTSSVSSGSSSSSVSQTTSSVSTSSSVSQTTSSVSTSSSVSQTTSSVSTSSSASQTTSSVSTSSSVSQTTSSVSSSSSSASSTSVSSSSSFTTPTTTLSTTSTSTTPLPTTTTTSVTTTSTTSTTTTTSLYQPTCTDYYLEKIKHQGFAPFSDDSSTYKVFRNVKDYGAKGDGVADDTDAINDAIRSAGRCAPRVCGSTTQTPALIYFPAGTYRISKPIINYYFTQVVGNPLCMPVLKATPNFVGRWLFDGDAYQSDGKLGWAAVNVFFRQFRNIEIDLTEIPSNTEVAGIHWPVGQASSIQNVVFRMSESKTNNKHQGIFIEEGSGGLVADLVFYGGAQGAQIGNQQFTMRNLTFHRSLVAIDQLWSWGWTYHGLNINNCDVGIKMNALDSETGNLGVGSLTVFDSSITNTPIGILTGRATKDDINQGNGKVPGANTLILENLSLQNVPVAIQGPQGPVLAGSAGVTHISAWGTGHKVQPNGAKENFQGEFTPLARLPKLLTAGGDYYHRSKPQYENQPASNFLSARDLGAKGDSSTDDTAALRNLFQQALAQNKIAFIDYGQYVVTDTIRIPAGSRVVGEAYPVIMSSGPNFNDMTQPRAVVQIGGRADKGTVELSDFVVSTRGGQAGAILIEYNLDASGSTPAGLWDVHTRVGGFQGSEQQKSQCPLTSNLPASRDNIKPECIIAFMSMHVTKNAANLYMENVWLWVADHDIEDQALTQITVFAGRGLLIESTSGGIWLWGTSVEHHVLNEYQFSNTRDIFMGQIQTETAYYQANPDVHLPFPTNPTYDDPTWADSPKKGWGFRAHNSRNLYVYGAGLYSFFDNNDVSCADQKNGQTCQSDIASIESSTNVQIYNLNTISSSAMITYNGSPIAPYTEHRNGFVSNIALFQAL